MLTYEEYQNEVNSEKIVLATIDASKRLIGFSVYSGTIYILEDFDISVILNISDSGTSLIEVSNLASVVPGSFFNDRVNKILYLETTGSVNPNGRFLVLKFKNFFSNVPVNAPNDLSSGFDVPWLPYIKKTSFFGVELDNDDQIGLALEGGGSLTFLNDRNYFDERYEGLVWENQEVMIYSWNRLLEITDAKLIYRGVVNDKDFNSKTVTFKLKDQLAALREEFPINDLSLLSGALIPSELGEAKQRVIYGNLSGYRPTNIDQQVEGYELTGTVSVSAASKTLTGVGTLFLKELSPEDTIILNDGAEDVEFTIESITSNIVATLTEAPEFSASAISFLIEPDLPKKYINREWLIAGHECRQLETTIINSFSLNKFTIASVQDLNVGDEIFIGDPGTGEVTSVEEVLTSGQIRVSSNLLFPPTTGTSVIRPCVQNLRINNKKLRYDRDYTIQISGDTRIKLDEDAEKNVASIRKVNGSLTFNGTRAVTGSGTQFVAQLQPGYWIRLEGELEFFEILSIESETALTLRTVATYSGSGSSQYKAVNNFNVEEDVLTCDVYGKTSDGTKDGFLLATGSDIAKDILTLIGITNLNLASFAKSKALSAYTLGFAIPETFDDTSVPIVRDIINNVNISILGSVVQNEDFEIEYNTLRPNRPATSLKFQEADILKFSLKSSADRIVKTARVIYNKKEYNFETLDESVNTEEKTSDIGNYLVQKQTTKDIETVLRFQKDARIMVNRWAYLLETSTNIISIETKLQAMRLQVGDVILIEHSKLFERIGGGKRRYAAIQAISKDGANVLIEADDLGNAFNRVCVISENGEPDFDNSIDSKKAQNGFITDSFGLINNDSKTIGLNVIW